MSERIDVGKLRGAYYNNDKDMYGDMSSLSSIKQSMASDFDSLCENTTEIAFNDTEDMIVDYIKSMPVANYNDLSNKNSKQLADLEAYVNLVNVVAMFVDITSLSTIILIYCDYFNLKYEKVINELPNGLKIKLYEELKKHTRNTDILDSLFGFGRVNIQKPLF